MRTEKDMNEKEYEVQLEMANKMIELTKEALDKSDTYGEATYYLSERLRQTTASQDLFMVMYLATHYLMTEVLKTVTIDKSIDYLEIMKNYSKKQFEQKE